MHTLEDLNAGRLAGSKRLDLRCGLTEFPREIFSLADSLEVLNLSGNALRSLPDDLHRLTRLRVLFCSDNLFTELPACLGQCTALTMIGFKANVIENVPGAALPPLLRWLILTDNRLTDLPTELGERPHLQKLMLAQARLTLIAGCEVTNGGHPDSPSSDLGALDFGQQGPTWSNPIKANIADEVSGKLNVACTPF